MVLINGIKYACERCIRGHRVTTCTHTDQPLTMIKPKGRPASQCQHCREQRKMKSLHVTCTCGKRGKSPGMHLASCLCHKNSHCTCSSNASRKGDKTKKKLSKSLSDLNIKTLDNNNGTSAVTFNSPSVNTNYVIEDIVLPFETGTGLFDLFSPSDRSMSNLNLNALDETSNSKSVVVANSSNGNSHTDGSNGNTRIGSNEDDASKDSGIELVDNMFPLFPLVGSCSFDDSKSQPLSSLPTPASNPSNTSTIDVSKKPVAPNSNNSTPGLANNTTHQPKPIKATPTTTHYQPIRPKRPESVLSVTSNSSTATNVSKNFDNCSNINSLPNQSNSTAFPPSIPLTSFDLNKLEESNNYSKYVKNQGDDDLFNPKNLFAGNELQFSEYNQFINTLNVPQGQRNEQQSQQQQFNGLSAQASSSNQEQFQNQQSNDFEMNVPLFNDLMSPIYDPKNDSHF